LSLLSLHYALLIKRQKFIQMLYTVNEQKIQLLSPETDIEQIKLNLASFEKIARGAQDGGPIAQLEIPERFRWLTAVRSSVIQTSRPHPGFCTNMEQLTEKLFFDLVL